MGSAWVPNPDYPDTYISEIGESGLVWCTKCRYLIRRDDIWNHKHA